MGGAWSFAFALYFNEGRTQDLTDPKLEATLFNYEDMFSKLL